MKVLLCLLSLFSGSELRRLLLEEHEAYIGDSRAREIHLNLRKRFPHSGGKMNNEYIKWLLGYGDIDHFPHCQKLILDLTTDFSISNIEEDARIIEKIELFYETARENERSVLEAFFQDASFVKDLVEGGFQITKYSFGEMIGLDYQFRALPVECVRSATEPEFRDLIDDFPRLVDEFDGYDQVTEASQLLKEGKPASLIADLARMMIRDLRDFSELPAMTNERVRPILSSIVDQTAQPWRAVKLFEMLSRYPEAISCLSLVQDPDRGRKQQLILLFPHHVSEDSCDEIINLDLREVVGGWRQEIYNGDFDYLAVLQSNSSAAGEIMAVDNGNIRDRMILDWLWILTYRNNPDFREDFERIGTVAVRSIVNKEDQDFIYQMLESAHYLFTARDHKGSILSLDSEEKYWKRFVDRFLIFSNSEVEEVLRLLLIPRIFPGKGSRLALSIHLDMLIYCSKDSYIDSILQEYLSGDGRTDLEKHIIESLQEVFEIQIDPLILNGLKRSNFEKFGISAYKRIRKANIRFVEFGKLLQLFRKQRMQVSGKLVLEEIISRATEDYYGEPQAILIETLILFSHKNAVSLDGLEMIGDASTFLNFLYSAVDPVSFFKVAIRDLRTVHKDLARSNLELSSTLDSFGFDFLKDVAALTHGLQDQRSN